LEDDEVLRTAFERCGLDAGRRGETLDISEFARLARELFPLAAAPQAAGLSRENGGDGAGRYGI
jgi:hypothetical protein